MKHVVLFFICLIVSVAIYAQKGEKAELTIVYIGNSITQGVLLANPMHDAPPVQASTWLQKQSGIAYVEFSNQGVGGTTTVDFLPASNSYFPKVKQAADEFQKAVKGILIFSIMLGTNDSACKGPNGAPVDAPQYQTNIKVIVDKLLSSYPQCKVVLHRPVWYSPNTHNGAIYLKEGLERLKSYFPKLKTLVGQYAKSHPHRVFIGDTEAFVFFKENYLTDFIPENGNAGTFYLHPNKKGAARLGEFWGKAIYKTIGE